MLVGEVLVIAHTGVEPLKCDEWVRAVTNVWADFCSCRPGAESWHGARGIFLLRGAQRSAMRALASVQDRPKALQLAFVLFAHVQRASAAQVNGAVPRGLALDALDLIALNDVGAMNADEIGGR
jgi:hypothetical protein